MFKKGAFFIAIGVVPFLFGEIVNNTQGNSSCKPVESSELSGELKLAPGFCFFAPSLFDLEKFLDESPELEEEYFKMSEKERQELVDVIEKLGEEFLKALVDTGLVTPPTHSDATVLGTKELGTKELATK